MSEPKKQPRQTLFDRKLKLLETLACQPLFEKLDALDDEMVAALADVERTAMALTGAKAVVEMAEITACWEVEGKNETERKNKKVAALRDSPEYQAAVHQLTELEGQKVEANLRLSRAERQAKHIDQRVQHRIAVLRFLGE